MSMKLAEKMEKMADAVGQSVERTRAKSAEAAERAARAAHKRTLATYADRILGLEAEQRGLLDAAEKFRSEAEGDPEQ